jgi:hypothetical protein
MIEEWIQIHHQILLGCEFGYAVGESSSKI